MVVGDYRKARKRKKEGTWERKKKCEQRRGKYPCGQKNSKSCSFLHIPLFLTISTKLMSSTIVHVGINRYECHQPKLKRAIIAYVHDEKA